MRRGVKMDVWVFRKWVEGSGYGRNGYEGTRFERSRYRGLPIVWSGCVWIRSVYVEGTMAGVAI